MHFHLTTGLQLRFKDANVLSRNKVTHSQRVLSRWEERCPCPVDLWAVLICWQVRFRPTTASPPALRSLSPAPAAGSLNGKPGNLSQKHFRNVRLAPLNKLPYVYCSPTHCSQERESARCPCQWMKTRWSEHTAGDHPPPGKKKSCPVLGGQTWMGMVCTVLGDISQAWKDKHCLSSHVCKI